MLIFKLAVSLILFGVATVATAQTSNLQAELERVTASVGGRVGIGVRHLESGREFYVNRGVRYPMASVFKADAQDDYADIGALEVSAYTPQRGTFGKDSAVVNRRIRKDGITTIENIQLSIAKSAYNQAEFVTLFVRGSDGQWSVGVARFKRVR